MLMIKAGSAVDEMIENLIPLLEKGDIIIDGGNSTSGYNPPHAVCGKQRLLYVGTAFPAAKKARSKAEHDAAAPTPRGHGLSRFFRPSARRLKTARPAVTGWAKTARPFC